MSEKIIEEKLNILNKQVLRLWILQICWTILLIMYLRGMI